MHLGGEEMDEIDNRQGGGETITLEWIWRSNPVCQDYATS